MVTGRPAKPTTPFSTTSAPRAASTMPSTPTSDLGARRHPVAHLRVEAGSPITTRPGRNSAAWATSTSAELLRGQGVTRIGRGSRRMTSSAWVPIEPVEPIRLTERISSPEVQRFDHEVRGGEDEEEPVDPVEDAAVAGQEPPHVLEARGAA